MPSGSPKGILIDKQHQALRRTKNEWTYEAAYSWQKTPQGYTLNTDTNALHTDCEAQAEVWRLHFTCNKPQQCIAMLLLKAKLLFPAQRYSNIDECAQLMKYSCFHEERSIERDPGITAKYHSMTNALSHMAVFSHTCRQRQRSGMPPPRYYFFLPCSPAMPAAYCV